jgi:hypothetical protein
MRFFVLFPLGASHADELGYLFHSSPNPDMKLDPDDDSLQMIRRMVMMWANFAKSGYRHYFNRFKHVVCTTFLKFKNFCLQLYGVERSSHTRYLSCNSLCHEDLQQSSSIAPHLLNYLRRMVGFTSRPLDRTGDRDPGNHRTSGHVGIKGPRCLMDTILNEPLNLCLCGNPVVIHTDRQNLKDICSVILELIPANILHVNWI